MKVQLIDEYNAQGHLVCFGNLPGAYVRGATLDEALLKAPAEAKSYCLWAGLICPGASFEFDVVQEKSSNLQVHDADSDVLFDSERGKLSFEEYTAYRNLALKSARDFLTLYLSVPDKDNTVLRRRQTFYGDVPVSAAEMYRHTKNVNDYYFGAIGVKASNEPDIYVCRQRGFELLEDRPDYLDNKLFIDDNAEEWSLKKVLRRFIWHDRIHARAMYRMATRLCGENAIADPFCFGSR